MNIRKLTTDDTPAFRELRLRALKEHPEAFSMSYESEFEMPVEQATDRMRQTTESHDSFILGTYEDENLVGMVGFFRNRGRKVRHNCTIWGMYVVTEAQGRGIGKALLTQAIECIMYKVDARH
jgi:GNAT superfamily N-acetyltransferase